MSTRYPGLKALWNYAAATGGITNNTAVPIVAAGAAGTRNYVGSIDFQNESTTVDTEIVIQDGAAGAILWRGFATSHGAGSSQLPFTRIFDPPLRGSPATLLQVQCVTTGAQVYFNATGFTGP